VKDQNGRIPLRDIILAQTGQDLRACKHCDTCKQLPGDRSGTTIGEIIQTAARDDPAAISNPWIWRLELEDLSVYPCQAGFNLAEIFMVLWQEAGSRGLAPAEDDGPEADPGHQPTTRTQDETGRSALRDILGMKGRDG
jgi:hypothetical protein